jgi:hypothetical protein
LCSEPERRCFFRLYYSVNTRFMPSSCIEEEAEMNIASLCAGVAAICLSIALSTAAEAASKRAPRNLVTVSGCATMGPPTMFCVVVPAGGVSYIVKSARPQIPLDLGVTVVGRKTGESDPWCDGIDLQVISWRTNARLTCPR